MPDEKRMPSRRKKDEFSYRKARKRKVGKARTVPLAFRENPHEYLEATDHPYAPFVSDTIKWSSFAWHDAATYEGLTRFDQPHGTGVFTVGRQGKGAGLAKTKPGDKYEGEFHFGFAHGVGMRTSSNGKVYRGEYTEGRPDGCGMEYDLSPWTGAVAAGTRPDVAWHKTRKQVHGKMRLGLWSDGVFVSDSVEEDFGLCTMHDIRKLMVEVSTVVTRARMFSFKPSGDATFYKSHLDGVPMKSMQHPLHYPHGTLFMAPGPAGQTAGVPDDPALKDLMTKAALNARNIYRQFNFPDRSQVPSKSFLGKAMQMGAKKEKARQKQSELEARMFVNYQRRVEDDEEEQDKKEEKRSRRKGKGKGKGPGDEPKEPPPPPPPVDDSDLVADATAAMRAPARLVPGPGPRVPGGEGTPPTGSAFGSISAAHHGPALVRALRQRRHAQVQQFVVGPATAVPSLLRRCSR